MRPALAAPLLICALCAAAPGRAQDTSALKPLTAMEFDARTVGRTITYSVSGQPYGVEQYLPGRRVLWAFTESECKEGTWFQAGEQICFDYQDDSGLQCWTFFATDQGLSAKFQGDDAAEPLVSLNESPAPLACRGPDIGA
ncbi:MAG: hypothetical protein PHX82_12345 [Paracoccaceae bacterium]|jgi:hypothetical protein|nr:hypothetical protein [Paracoccaceae bacterium]